jgi:hypothetical protein
MLAFTSVYFLESGLINGLWVIGVKISVLCSLLAIGESFGARWPILADFWKLAWILFFVKHYEL